MDDDTSQAIGAECTGAKSVAAMSLETVSPPIAMIRASKSCSALHVFWQMQRLLARGEVGLGTGLALVKTLVELDGGRVEAQSAVVGRAAGCTVCVPRPIDDEVQA